MPPLASPAAPFASRPRPALALGVALAISAACEPIERAAAMALGADADDFLATQGAPWGTQPDMLFALSGAVTALLLFSRQHDRRIARLSGQQRLAGGPAP